jgi:uncharacterized protein DUF2510
MQDPTSGAASAHPKSKARIAFAVLAAALVIVAAVGVFLPWATTELGDYSESLADSSNGGAAIMLVPLAIIAVLAALGVVLARRRAASISLVSVALGLSVLFTGFALLVMVGMVDKERELNSSFELVNIGVGAFITCAAIGLLTVALIGLLVSIVRVKRAPGSRPAQAAAPAAVPAAAAAGGSGWYPDPFGEGGLMRYHDGQAWTGHTAPRERAGRPVPGAA